MATTNLGKVSLTPRGQYDPEAQYQALDVIQHGGSGYVVLRPVQGVEPVNGEDYMLLAAKGEKGPKGSKGDGPFQIAAAGGYAGTEAEFNEALTALGDIGAVLDAINGEVI